MREPEAVLVMAGICMCVILMEDLCAGGEMAITSGVN